MPRYFITGATGLVGSALVKELQAQGYQVTGLARSDSSAQKLLNQNVDVVRGDLNDLQVLKQAARASDGVIHLAFIHDWVDFDKYNESARIDQQAIDAMLEALEGSGKPFVGVSGTLQFDTLKPDLANNQFSEAIRTPENSEFIRGVTENIVLAASAKNIKTSVVRFAPTVHGPTDQGLIPIIIRKAKEMGFAPYLGDGTDFWSAVHVEDTAVLLRLVLEKGQGMYHAAAENLTSKQIATHISEVFGLPVKSIPKSEGVEKLGVVAGLFFGKNAPTSSERTQRELGWTPVHSSLAEDIRTTYSSY